jgi:hypothetical protein
MAAGAEKIVVVKYIWSLRGANNFIASAFALIFQQ